MGEMPHGIFMVTSPRRGVLPLRSFLGDSYLDFIGGKQGKRLPPRFLYDTL